MPDLAAIYAQSRMGAAMHRDEQKRRQVLAKYERRAREKLRKKRMLKAAERWSDATREDLARRAQDSRFQFAMSRAIEAGRESAPIIGVDKRPCHPAADILLMKGE
jgi:hypothetical protein